MSFEDALAWLYDHPAASQAIEQRYTGIARDVMQDRLGELAKAVRSVAVAAVEFEKHPSTKEG